MTPATRSRRRPQRRPPRASTPGTPAAPDLPLSHPAILLAILAAAVSIVLSAGYRLHDTDLWQLLVVGKAIWARHAIPRTDQWTWVGWGDPQVTSSWGFRALIWPLWSTLGVRGLFLYRWTAALAAFGLMALAARRGGARGTLPWFVAAWGALAWRLRAEVRPESLVAVLVALEVLILEGWRAGGRDRRPWLIAIAWLWANVHLSWWIGMVLVACYGADAVARGPGGARRRRALEFGGLVLACGAVALVNPFGVRALAEPIAFALRWRHEPMFRNIVELWPVNWSAHRTDLLPALMLAWPLLLLWRWRRAGPDVAGMLLCAAFTWLGIGSQRFLGFTALLATPFVARDLAAWLGARRLPAWTSRARARGALAAAAALAIGIPEWSRPELPLGIGIEPSLVPAAACDFLAREQVRGRTFNHFHLGGYLAYRGWPERDRLPFVTTQPENIRPAIRDLYPRVFVDPAAWRDLERLYAFDIAVLAREQDPGDRLLDYLDADSSWALVFVDDAVEVLVKRDGPHADVARRFGYRAYPAGIRRRTAAVPQALRDTTFRSRLRAELERMAGSSPGNGGAYHLLGTLDLMDGRDAEARAHLEAALAKQPFLPQVHLLLGVIAMNQRRFADAVHEFRRERALHGGTAGLDTRLGAACEALGRVADARRAYARELREHPEDAGAAAALARLGGAP